MVTNENVLKQKDMDELLLFLGTSKNQSNMSYSYHWVQITTTRNKQSQKNIVSFS